MDIFHLHLETVDVFKTIKILALFSKICSELGFFLITGTHALTIFSNVGLIYIWAGENIRYNSSLVGDVFCLQNIKPSWPTKLPV